MITIDEALRRFLVLERERGPDDAGRSELLLDNLISFLDGYGYQYLDEGADDDFDDDDDLDEDDLDLDEDDFASANEPRLLPTMMGEFLYDWTIRKSAGTGDDARATAALMARLMTWLASEGLADRTEASEAAELARSASEELPRAHRLSDLLYDVAKATPTGRAEVEEEVDDFLCIERIEPGRLWFDQGVGPVAVPPEATEIAEVGWWVNLYAEKRAGDWLLLETGYVYPRLAAEGGEDEDEDEDGSAAWDVVFPEPPSRN